MCWCCEKKNVNDMYVCICCVTWYLNEWMKWLEAWNDHHHHHHHGDDNDDDDDDDD